jgi:hypothetical protein
LTTIILPEASAPAPARPVAGPAIPPRIRRPYPLARRTGRRATYTPATPVVLPRLAFVTTVVGALTLTLAGVGILVAFTTVLP